jgi:hypothetical protein
MPNGERVRTVSRIGPRQARAGVSAVEQLRVCRKKRGPVVGTAPFPLVSILAVGLCDPPEHLLPADDQGDQRCEKKPIPDTEGDDGDGAYGRLLSVATAYSESPSHFPQNATAAHRTDGFRPKEKARCQVPGVIFRRPERDLDLGGRV